MKIAQSRQVAKFGFVLAWVAATAVSLFAQSNKVTIVGVTTDSSGAVLPNVSITATNVATSLLFSAMSDEEGRYTILNIDPGTYNVQATASGFGTIERLNQTFLVGQTVTVNFQMQVASVAQKVEVSSAPPMISTTESVVSRVIEQQEVDNLPTITRRFSDLAALSPGVTVSGSSVLIGGSTNYQTQYVVDGGSSQNSFFGGSYINFAQDWIQEFSLVSEQAPAEYGRASGGFVNAITRSGTNEVHGRAYGFFQNAALNSTPKFLPAFAPTKPPYSLQRIGGMIGGPVKKDKLFYFIGYEYYHNINSTPVNVNPAFVGIASTSGVFPVTSLTHVAMVKLDYQGSVSNRFSFRMAGEYDGAGNTGVGAGRTLGNGTTGKTKSYLPSGSWTHIISPTELNELQFVYARSTPYAGCNYARIVGPYPGYPSLPGSTVGGDPVGWWAQISYPTASGGAVTTGCPTNYSYDDRPWVGYRDTTLTDTFSLTHGAHDVKFGAAVGAENLKWFFIRNSADGAFSINGSKPFNPSDPTTFPTLDTMNGFGGASQLGQHYDIWGPNLAFFAQDSFKVTPTLTLNMGLRYNLDFENHEFTHRYILPHIATDMIAPLTPVNTDFGEIAPRFGYAWTPFHDNGRTVLRGGLGVFYDEAHTEMQAIEFGQAIDSVTPVVVNATRPGSNPYCYSDPLCSGSTVPTADQKYVEEVLAYALTTYTVPNFTLGTYTFGGHTYTIPAPTVSAGGKILPAPTTSGTIVDDQNFKIPGEFQVSQGIGHQFGNSFNLQADYVYIRGFRQILFRNTNINQQGALINPSYGSIIGVYNGGLFNNTSFRVKAAYRDHRGDSAQLAYTLGWARDDSLASFNTASTAAPQSNPFNPMVDYGPSAQDARHVINLSGVLQIPWGFQFAPIFAFTSPLPYTATTTASVPGCPVYYSQCYPTGYSRNTLRGIPTISLSARLSKFFRIGERRSIELLIEGYNIPNLTNYTTFTTSVLSPSFEKPTAAGAMRQLQVGARLDF